MQKQHLAVGMAVAIALLSNTTLGDSTPPHGTLAAAIRSADLPCAQVIKVTAIGESRWSVRCNSGTYTVIRDKEGRLSASR